MNKAVILHSVDDAIHCVKHGLYKDSLLFSTSSSVDTYLMYNHNLKSKCLSSFLSEERVVTEISTACEEVDNIIKDIDKLYSPNINEQSGFVGISFISGLYSFSVRYYYTAYKLILLAIDSIIKRHNISHLSIYQMDLSRGPLLCIKTSIKDITHFIDKELSVEVIHNGMRRKRNRAFELLYMCRKRPGKVFVKLKEYLKLLRGFSFRPDRETVLIYESLHDLDFLRDHFRDFNIIYYTAHSGYPLLRRRKRFNGSSKINLKFDCEIQSFQDLAKAMIKEDFERNAQRYVNSIKCLDNIHRKYNIKLAITGDSAQYGTKAIIFEYLKSIGVKTILAQHGCNYGLQDAFGFHKYSDYSRCDYFISYGFTDADLQRLYGGKLQPVRCKILPYGSAKIKMSGKTRPKRKKIIDILFPMTMSLSMYAHAMTRLKPDLITDIQLKLLNHLDTKRHHSIVVKPFTNYNYDNCSVMTTLNDLSNINIIDNMNFTEVMEKYDVKSVLIEYISTSLGEAIPYDCEIFVLGNSMDYFDHDALSLMKKRVHYTADVEEMKELIDSYLEGRLAPKRDREFAERYLVKENTESNIIDLIASITSGEAIRNIMT